MLAQRLLSHAGSLAALAAADRPRLREAPGVGPRRADVLAALMGAPNPPAPPGGRDGASDEQPAAPTG